SGRWFSVSDNIVSSKNDTIFKENFTESNVINVGGVIAKIDEETRIFAADVENNALREMKALGEIFEFYAKRRKPLKDVYMGYDTFVGKNEAKVIVFGDVEKFQGKEELRRVIMPVGSNLRFSAQSMLSGEEKVFSLEDVLKFPTGYTLDYLDVILMYFDDYESSKLIIPPQILIDHSEADVYEVAEIQENFIVIRDKDGYEFPFNTMTTATFTQEGLEEGSHVQILIMPPDFIIEIIGRDNLMNLSDFSNIDIGEIIKNIDFIDAIEIIREINSLEEFDFKIMAISVVDEPLRGALPLGIRTGKERGFIESLEGTTATVVTYEEGLSRNHKNFEVAATDRIMARLAYLYGFEIVYDVDYRFGNTAYMYNIGYYFDHQRLYGSAMDNWIFRSITNSMKFTWSRKEVEEMYAIYSYISESDNVGPVLFVQREILQIAIESYNDAYGRYGGPGKIDY
ncbi:MAG: hypothetical protein Q4G11_06380, partial [Gallicola sp.]|nr:hypothetical protein [Gallicola sp.]